MSASRQEAFRGTERFELLRQLGKGGFGMVYEALDRKRNTVVALKTLRKPDAPALLRLKQEFRALADLVHPNLVNLYELYSEGEHWFFTMEMVDRSRLLRTLRQPSERSQFDVDGDL